MRLDRQWPSWHPNEELKADQLLGLEDFLLARAVLADEEAHGVDLFDWRSDLQIAWFEDGLQTSVKRLRGVTPAGEPVCVTTDEQLSARSLFPKDSTNHSKIAAA